VVAGRKRVRAVNETDTEKGMSGKMAEADMPKASIDLYDAKTIEERQSAAGRCSTELNHDTPTYVDEMDDRVSKAYAGWPTRLYLIGVDGKVAYAGGLGPFGYKPEELGEAIEKYLAPVKAAIG
tara:strand:- start:136 stop:507 length:372 start_codon:yes stop_codon:yes gene_type:complete